MSAYIVVNEGEDPAHLCAAHLHQAHQVHILQQGKFIFSGIIMNMLMLLMPTNEKLFIVIALFIVIN